jgi:Family of unknown function (DUF5719)
VSRLLRGRFAPLALVLLAVGALGAAAWASCPGGAMAGSQQAVQRAQVTSATRICPLPATSSHGTRVAVFAVPATASTPARQAQGGAQLAALGSAAPPLEQVTQPGRLWLYSSGHGDRALRARGAAQAPVAVRAAGVMARGLEVEETSRPQAGTGAGTGIRCPEPGTDFWFAGPGQATGGINLYLINPDSQPASADVDIYTDSGPLQGTDTGLTVPAGGSLVQAVDRIAPGSHVVALHVRTTAGRVAAAVQAGSPGQGSWLPATGQPATARVVPGLPAGGSGRRLYLADPGGRDADVSVQAVTSNGEYEPTGGGGIDVPSGSATSVDLPSMNGIPAALRVTANVPVAAALMAGGGYGGSAAPLSGQPAVAADNTAGHGYSTTLVLSAPGAAARVALATATTAGMTAGTGSSAGQVVTVAARHSTSAKIAAPHGGSSGFAVVVTPLAGSGPVYAARVLSGPDGTQAIMPLVSAPAWVPLPQVAGSLTAVMP